ncbi:MAG: TonB-dependent receptor plug domain-containing protein [Lentimicrobiaceae bacterium]|nr:TonB-dependent receptor plug domain-containing protein [Lentimicrobiaceae bacterium]
MIKKLLFTLFLCMLAGSVLYAQSTIKGEVKDQNGNPVMVQILLKQDGRVVNGAYSDDLGAYQIFGVPAGTYDITAQGMMTCLTTHTEKGIYVPSSEVKFVNLKIDCSSTELKVVEVVYVPPVFAADNTTSSDKLTGDEVRKAPGRSIAGVLSNLGGVASTDGTTISSVRGNRSDGQQTIIDGVRVRGGSGVAMQSLEGFELIQGGVPAEYGDGTSFTILTTRGVAKDFHGSFEIRSSLEGYGQMLAAASLSGPIIKGKTPQEPARMGFLLSAEGTYNKDRRPVIGGSWIAKPEVIQDIIAKPVDYRYIGESYVSYYRANFLGANDFKKIRVHENTQDWGFLAHGKIDIMGGGKDARGKSKNNLRLSIGGSYEYNSGLDGLNQAWSLFNAANNSKYTNNTLRVNARLNHRVKTDTAANAILKNVMYDINVSYTLYNFKREDKNHKDNFFNYGYIGKFSTERENFYAFEERRIVVQPGDTVDATVTTLNIYQQPVWVDFDKNGFTNNGNYFNPGLVPYTQGFIDFIKEKTGVDINNATQEGRSIVQQFLGGFLQQSQYQSYYGLLNGDNPFTIANGLYIPPGALSYGFDSFRAQYEKTKSETFGAKASLSLNIKDHEIKFGFEVDKLTLRNYTIAARELWGLMRGYTYNDAYFQFDFANPYWKSGGLYPRIDEFGMLMDTIMYPIIPNLTNFDKNLRNRRGITDNTVFLDIDSYDPNDFSLDLFSNYELLNSGNNVVSYRGYDYTGKLSRKKLDLNTFFNGEDLHSNDKYAIGAYEPIYLAFFLQDKFSISNLIFNLGLRFDYFNANQPVLKDPFLLRDACTVQDLVNAGWTIPIDNYKPEWIPYVAVANEDLDNASHSIVAYRNGKTWYNDFGQEVADPTSYLGAGGPVLVNYLEPDALTKVSSDAFTKYKPYLSLMPRISFSFPVSTNSVFYAHYNIITYRPQNLQINPIAYLFISESKYRNETIDNPNLRSQRTVDYEIGFRQKVGENAAINFGAYYSEKKDQLQTYRYMGAYPNSYYSYENIDFGTTQGFMFGFTMRGAKNLTFRANYTLQFAKGTGSSATSNKAILASGQPNLRTLTNLEYDQRHNISASIDLRYGSGTDYNGPITRKQKKGTDTTKEIRWFENAGVTLMINAASGMPYSRSSIVYSALRWGESTEPRLKGTINGANMPWIFRCDLRVDKSFMLNLASKKKTNDSGKREYKQGMLTVYLDFQNLLNLKTVVDVYRYTGSPIDDGYISSLLFQNIIANGMAFNIMPSSSATNYYNMSVADPFNYNRPFTVALGVSFSF